MPGHLTTDYFRHITSVSGECCLTKGAFLSLCWTTCAQ
jgi:hypothetical protein